MARASIYAMPARYEPFGLSILEAGLSGCALVLGDIPSLREHWDGAAAFVAPDDRGALRRAIGRLIDSPARRAELGRRARERGHEFTVGRMVDAYQRLYHGLLCPSGHGALEVSSCAS
jgi:glycosyltransferase involved in cell wall biosynthesis